MVRGRCAGWENNRFEGRRRREGRPAISRVLEYVGLELPLFHSRRPNLLLGNPLSIAEHHQQMPPVERSVVVVSDTRLIRQHEGIRDSIESLHPPTFALLPLKLKDIEYAFGKNLRTDKPSPRQGERRTVGCSVEQ